MTFTRGVQNISTEVQYPSFARARIITVPNNEIYAVPSGLVIYVYSVVVYGKLYVDGQLKVLS